MSYGMCRRCGTPRAVCPFSHWDPLPPMRVVLLVARRGSGVPRQAMHEYYTIVLIAMPGHPAGVGIQPGPPRGVEGARRMATRPLTHRLMEHRRRLASARLRPRPGHRARDGTRHVDVDLRRTPRRERAVRERHPDRRVRALREVGTEIRPRLLLGAVELGRHLLQRGAELAGHELELCGRLDLVD